MPTFQGYPPSVLAKITTSDSSLALWTWVPINQLLRANDVLVASGYERVSIKRGPSPYLCLTSQGCDIQLLDPRDSDDLELWAMPEDIQQVERYPVILAFPIDNPDENTIQMLQPLPPPEIGKFGAVISQGETHAYPLSNLPSEAQQLQARLHQALLTLVSPGDWYTWTPYLDNAAHDPSGDRIPGWRTSLLNQFGKARDDIRILVEQMETAHERIRQVQIAQTKPDWSTQWQEIRHIMRDLAAAYWTYYQQQSATQITALTPATPTKRTRGPRRPMTAIVAKGRDTVTIRSDIFNHGIINALRDKDSYQYYANQGIAEYIDQMHKGKKQEGQLIITIKPLENEGLDTVLTALNTLGDSCVDTYMALMAIALDKNGTERIRMPFFVSPDDILSVCGKEKSKGSYTPGQRAAVTAHLKTLSQSHIIATLPSRTGKGKRGETTLRAEGAIIDLLSGKIGEYKTITGEEIWEKRSVALGEWVTMIPELNQMTATMLRRVLAYSAKNQRYQKRIGTYLTLMFRNNAKHGSDFKCSMQALLDGAGIKSDRRVGEFREAIEKALSDLKLDGVIGNYARIVDATPKGQENEAKIRERAHGWWDTYSHQQWRFTAPDYIKEQYKGLLREGNIPE